MKGINHEKELKSKIKKIDKLIPYPKKLKKNLMNNYFHDLQEELGESVEIPTDLQSNSRQIARQLAKSQEWPIKIADMNKRTFAYIIDVFFSFLFGIISWFFYFLFINITFPHFFETTRSLIPAMTIFLVTMSVFLYTMIFYPFLSEGLFSMTIGKKMMGLIVINDNKLKITWTQSFIRSLTKLFPLLLLFESFVGFYQKNNSQRIMDKIAGTYVIEIRYESIIDQYISQVAKKIPNHTNELLIPLKSLKQEITEAFNNERGQKPIDILGLPDDIAKNIVKSNNWIKNGDFIVFRIFAYLFDLIISLTCASILITIIARYINSIIPNYFIELNTLDKLTVFLFVASIPLYILVFYPIMLEGIYSRTIGKWIFGLWTIDESGIKISWNQAVIRSLTKIFPILLIIDLIYLFTSKSDRRRPLDKIAKTKVVKIN